MHTIFSDFSCLFRIKGSPFPKSLAFMLSSLISSFIWAYILNGADATSISSTPITMFTSIVALAFTFCMNHSYSRFWEARSALQLMSFRWFNACQFTILMDEPDSKEYLPAFEAFRSEIVHLTSLLHAICIAYLHKTPRGLDVIGGVSNFESDRLFKAHDQVNLVFEWLQRCILTRMREIGGIQRPDPVKTKMFTDYQEGMNAFSGCAKLEDTPLPLPYRQMTELFLLILLLVLPPTIQSQLFNQPMWVSILVTVAISTIFKALQVTASEMQSPFGDRPNDLPLLKTHRDFNSILIQLLHAHEPEVHSQSSITEYLISSFPYGDQLNIPTHHAKRTDDESENISERDNSNLESCFTRETHPDCLKGLIFVASTTQNLSDSQNDCLNSNSIPNLAESRHGIAEDIKIGLCSIDINEDDIRTESTNIINGEKKEDIDIRNFHIIGNNGAKKIINSTNNSETVPRTSGSTIIDYEKSDSSLNNEVTFKSQNNLDNKRNYQHEFIEKTSKSLQDKSYNAKNDHYNQSLSENVTSITKETTSQLPVVCIQQETGENGCSSNHYCHSPKNQEFKQNSLISTLPSNISSPLSKGQLNLSPYRLSAPTMNNISSNHLSSDVLLRHTKPNINNIPSSSNSFQLNHMKSLSSLRSIPKHVDAFPKIDLFDYGSSPTFNHANFRNSFNNENRLNTQSYSFNDMLSNPLLSRINSIQNKNSNILQTMSPTASKITIPLLPTNNEMLPISEIKNKKHDLERNALYKGGPAGGAISKRKLERLDHARECQKLLTVKRLQAADSDQGSLAVKYRMLRELIFVMGKAKIESVISVIRSTEALSPLMESFLKLLDRNEIGRNIDSNEIFAVSHQFDSYGGYNDGNEMESISDSETISNRNITLTDNVVLPRKIFIN